MVIDRQSAPRYNGIMVTRDSALRKAIGLAGGQTALARRLGIAQSSVAKWEQIPLSRVLQIESEFAGEITRYEMRPDYFERETAA